MRWSEVTAEDVQRVRSLADRALTADEFQAYVSAPLGEDEREEQDGLIAWFMARYPTPASRLRYARRAYARWKAAQR